MSDGYRSVLSLAFELLRQMFQAFGEDIVLDDMIRTPGIIELPGVVAMDEIDAHLHPTWQTKIGNWFIEHFPSIQFFTTTHSPLVCRASGVRGSIWRLPVPGTDEQPIRVIGQDFDRLVKGNILETYGTDFFGEDVDIPEASKGAGERIAKLSMLKAKGRISEEENSELLLLQSARPTAASRIG